MHDRSWFIKAKAVPPGQRMRDSKRVRRGRCKDFRAATARRSGVEHWAQTCVERISKLEALLPPQRVAGMASTPTVPRPHDERRGQRVLHILAPWSPPHFNRLARPRFATAL